MSLILTIDTAVIGTSICLADGDKILASSENSEQREGASWLQPAIQQLFKEQAISLSSLSAVAISAGPGSYTGLRVGMASAKGLCYALKIPLIAINTLQMMAAAALPAHGLLCPMIDARRMEVFTALYDASLTEVLPSTPLVLDQTSFIDWLDKDPVLFFGNGSQKFQTLMNHPNARFKEVSATAQSMVPLAYAAFQKKDFADLAYCEPFYGKAFFSPPSKPFV
ncbi:MAG: tsaB [Flaviaesturariibacter sp.]|nr:tsaB [Flaviaesturariibacter sp.]